MARELQDLCHSGPRRPRQACARLPACRKPRWRRMGSQSLRRARRRMRRRLPGSGPPSLAAEEGKPDHFGTCAMPGAEGPLGSWSDYNHYEVSVTVANPRAVFGRDAIDMMGSIQSIATTAPGRSARRKWFHPGISLAPSRDAAAATAAVRLGPAACLNRGDAQRQSPRASDLDTRRPTNPKIGGTR
jgi:hypothetical protein